MPRGPRRPQTNFLTHSDIPSLVIREGDRHYGESDEDFWDRVKGESRDSGLTAHIRQHGILHPVQIDRSWPEDQWEIYNGHHRIAAALDVGALIPARWSGPGSSGRQTRESKRHDLPDTYDHRIPDPALEEEH